MAVFNLKIAGHTGTVSSLFESTPQYFKNYLTQEPSEFSFCVTREAIAFEQAALLEEAHRDGFKPRVFTDPFLERAAIQRAFAEFLFERDTLLFHGSSIAVDGEGYLFTAHSGTGKSTHTRLWRQVFGDRAMMINDDKPFICLSGDGAVICGAPWSGKHGLDTNIAVPLKGICILERGIENRISPIVPVEAREMLHKQSCPPLDAALLHTHHELVEQLLARVSLWRMECNKEIDAAITAHRAMSV